MLFAKEDLHASGYILGLLTTATGVANTVMWWVQPWMIKRLGARLALCVAMASTVLRCWLYTIATDSWQVVAIQLLHGISVSQVQQPPLRLTRTPKPQDGRVTPAVLH